ncbi:hypothetical protein E4508_23540, partial [Escherichia coli]|nr:hypothetical protein [Escherichia coli]
MSDPKAKTRLVGGFFRIVVPGLENFQLSSKLNSIINLFCQNCQDPVWVHHILQFLFSFKIYSTGVISASA